MSRSLSFDKCQGTGNDFVLVGPEEGPERFSADDIRFLCDRHFGIGSDGVLFAVPQGTGYAMRMFNPDGSEAEMCGNGIRCLAKHLAERGLVSGERFVIPTRAGDKTCTLFRDEAGRVDEVEVGMGRPDFSRAACGLDGSGEFLDQPVENGGGAFRGTAVSMGNPHLVVFADLDVEQVLVEGPRLERHPAFRQRTNVEFVRVEGPQHLRVIVYERGAGLTLACGTGTCASVAAAAALGHVDRALPVIVDLPGGRLRLRFDADGGILLRGPARHVFSGRVTW